MAYLGEAYVQQWQADDDDDDDFKQKKAFGRFQVYYVFIFSVLVWFLSGRVVVMKNLRVDKVSKNQFSRSSLKTLA